MSSETMRVAYFTSASSSGGRWRWVIVGERPTVSEAISNASSSVEAGTKPSRRTAFGSPPTMITRPQWAMPWAPQYHM